MARCANCGCSNLLPNSGLWWMGRMNARLFNTAQCGQCRRYVNARSGRSVLPTFATGIALQLAGFLLIVVLACVGQSLGGSLGLWFGIPFVLVFGLSLAWVFWIARTHH